MLIDDALRAKLQFDHKGELLKDFANEVQKSDYNPDEETREVTAMITDFFRWGDVTMRKPRREFNDMSVLTRMMVDQMSFNIYQPNNGQAYAGDLQNAWKSHAMRPIIRNKTMSIAAHVAAHMLFPKVFARNEQSESQQEAAVVMRDLIEYASDENDYAKQTLYAIITACFNPLAVIHVEYAESYRTIKTEKVDGKWKTEEILDEDRSGFKLTPVPVDELYIEDFYTEDIQMQDKLIWRRVQTYAAMQAKYGHHENFKYVKPGIQVLYNDANVGFYEVYDSNLQESLCEEVIFYCKSLDLQIYLVNGVMLCEPDEPNPRLDKKHPFIAFGYENMDEGRCFYKKSLAFKMQPDADIINTLYPLIIDGTYLNLMPPLIISGEEEIGADVVIPGVVTTLTNPESSIVPLRVGQDIRTGMETLMKVEESINQSSEMNIDFAQNKTAYATSVQQQQIQTMLGPFVTMISSYVKQYGELIKSDVVQYMTLPIIDKIVDNTELVFKTFIVNDRQVDGGTRSRKIQFDHTLKDEYTEDEEMDQSYDILEKQGGDKTKEEIYKVNPGLFRNLKYMITVSPDVITPRSDDLEKQMGIELLDKSIALAQAGVPVDLEVIAKDFMFAKYPEAKQDVDKYFKQAQPGLDPVAQAMSGQMGAPGGGLPGAPQPGQPLAGSPPPSPLGSTGKISSGAAKQNYPV